jgi:predicted regulator of Ras-like GTPase activity (Roadblock/LC7/MglB family)
MSTVSLHHDPGVIARASAALRHLRERSGSLRYAAVLTDDGFTVQSTSTVQSVHSATDTGTDAGNHDRLASVVSSLQALGEAAARELLDDDASPAVLVLSDSGCIVQVRVAGAALVLAALFDGDESVGQALASARETALELSPLTSREAR